MAVSVERVMQVNGEVRALISALDRELAANYTPEQRHGLSLDAIFRPDVHFFVARVDGEAAGCGGVALYSDFAEIKRMYVREGSRGQGVADAVIARLTAEAVAAGLTVLRLETGTEQTAALRFYRRCGFERCEMFEPYSSMPPEAVMTSVFLEKRLG